MRHTVARRTAGMDDRQRKEWLSFCQGRRKQLQKVLDSSHAAEADLLILGEYDKAAAQGEGSSKRWWHWSASNWRLSISAALPPFDFRTNAKCADEQSYNGAYEPANAGDRLCSGSRLGRAGSAASLNRLGEGRFQGSDRTGPVCSPGILPRQETTRSIGHHRLSDEFE